MNSKQAKEIPMETLLLKLGHKPTKTKGYELWYNSPFRNETVASFKLNTKFNSWYDFGLGAGGNILDFAITQANLHENDIKGALQVIENIVGRVHSIQTKERNINLERKKQDKSIKTVKPLENNALLDYLKSRKINIEIAKRYCQEIYYFVEDKNFFSICFKNDSGGFETRNNFSKRAFSPKDITTIKGEKTEILLLFEGFIDFLSFLTFYKLQNFNYSAIVLNSVNMKNKAIEKIKELKPRELYFYFDNDKAGEDTKKAIIEATQLPYKSKNELYKNFNDFNNFLKDRTKTETDQTN